MLLWITILCLLLDIGDLKLKIASNENLQTLNDRKIEIDGVPFCKRILLWGTSLATSKKDIECEVVRIMGPNSVSTIDYSEGAEFAIVNFKLTGIGIVF